MYKQLSLSIALFILSLVCASTIQAQTEGGLEPKTISDYKGMARLDNYSTNQVWSEYFTLPKGVSAYDNTDFAAKGITFSYENTNPELLEVTNCGYDAKASSRRNNISWNLKPLVAGEAVLTIHCTYNGVTTTATRHFIVSEAPVNPYEARTSVNISGLRGIRGTSETTATAALSAFFVMPTGWTDGTLFEANGISWGVESDNPDFIEVQSVDQNAKNPSAKILVKPVTATGHLTAWIERGGERVTSVYEADRYALRCGDDEASGLLDTTPISVDVLANDTKMNNVAYELSLVSEPAHGTVASAEVEDRWGAKRPGFSYTAKEVETLENWTPDVFRYRLTLRDSEGEEIEHAEADVNIILRKNPTVSKVFEFVPAPGQFVNSTGFTTGNVLIGAGGTGGSSSVPATTGMISLGGFGGYVVVGFDQPVLNDPRNPYGVDFTIGGNAFKADAKGYWSEPGAVMVMRDDNGNGKPDDTWYELAGSNYWFNTSRRNVTFTYEDPGYQSRYYIPYTTSDGYAGAVPSNQFHQQSYFPDPATYPDVVLTDGNKLALTGTHINAVYDLRAPSYIECYRPLGFGYCDNHATNGDLTRAHNPYYADENGDPTDGFDISWAVDAEGNSVTLDHIDFVKVYNSVNRSCGWLGEASTEVAGIVITRPDPNQEKPGDYYLNYAGITQLQVVEGKTCRFEGLAFHNGIPMRDATAKWSVEDPEVGTIDQNGVFTAIRTGATKVHFSATELAPEDVFEVEVVTLSGVQITREGNASTVSNEEGVALVGENLAFETVSITTNGSTLNGTTSNHFIYDTYMWTSSNPEVAAIEPGGFFHTLSAGETTLTVTSNTDPSLSADFKLSVIERPEVRKVNNYLLVQDGNLTQERLNETKFSCDNIFDCSFADGRANYKKRVDIVLTAVSPEEYGDMFYIEGNTLRNRLVKGDWREYRLTLEGTIDGVTTTIELPVLHTSTANTVAQPAIVPASVQIDRDTREGSLNLAEVFVTGENPEIYTPAYRLAEGFELPEGVSAEISDEGVLTVTLAPEAALLERSAIEVEGRISRATQKASAPSITPETPTWYKAVLPLTMTTGVETVTAVAADGPADVYNAQGVLIMRNADSDRLRTLGSGIYLIRRGASTQKLIK